ncbi:zinc finger (C3HC4-type RING finger) family protein [Striga hermonthica]|uniref:RING-type E3 ubiquitin transferase n=1 Tax=Striga hermonthica TaxID=68872 RepID=A0A9N7R3T1_STRHE|nr:zinc finger (C3HC4-type RING finger) family protein [Striga hermonthica]
MSSSSTYWCYRCNRFVRIFNKDCINCPDCNSGFVEEIEDPNSSSSLSDSSRRRFPAADMYMPRTPESGPGSGSGSGSVAVASPRLRRSRRNGGDRSPFNPVIVLRGHNDGGGGGGGGATHGGRFELYYDDGSGSGLRPLPATMSEFLLGSGFDRLLDQLSQIEANGIGRVDSNPPASKASIESMPTVQINDGHISVESHCAVCKDPFELGTEAREMPCKHLYHPDCILPWLALTNSCPVCRHELPTDIDAVNASRGPLEASRGGSNEVENDDETVGLTIWRLPGGGFAVGRFSGGRRGGERELPVVYTEVDGGFPNNGAPRRISWGSRGDVSRESGGLRRVLHNLFACFGRGGGGSSVSTSSSNSRTSRRRGSLSSLFGGLTSRRRGGLVFEVNNGNNDRGW